MGQLESSYVEGLGDEEIEHVLHGDRTLRGIARLIQSGEVKNILVLSGAGISVSAGIPDFRSPGVGLYSNLQKYNLPEAEDLFSLPYFKQNPDPFYCFAMELFPEQYFPTYTHYFIRLLQKKGLLLRNYTQNIDGLERSAEVSESRLVEAHGSLATCSCVGCGKQSKTDMFRRKIMKKERPLCKCGGLIKPDIVFFYEPLPVKFNWMSAADMISCDLLIVLGTSLSVQPFAGLVHKVREQVPRLLINREAVGPFRFHELDTCYRDVVWLGDCDDGVRELCDCLGWTSELDELYTKGRQKLSKVRNKFLNMKAEYEKIQLKREAKLQKKQGKTPKNSPSTTIVSPQEQSHSVLSVPLDAVPLSPDPTSPKSSRPYTPCSPRFVVYDVPNSIVPERSTSADPPKSPIHDSNCVCPSTTTATTTAAAGVNTIQQPKAMVVGPRDGVEENRVTDCASGVSDITKDDDGGELVKDELDSLSTHEEDARNRSGSESDDSLSDCECEAEHEEEPEKKSISDDRSLLEKSLSFGYNSFVAVTGAVSEFVGDTLRLISGDSSTQSTSNSANVTSTESAPNRSTPSSPSSAVPALSSSVSEPSSDTLLVSHSKSSSSSSSSVLSGSSSSTTPTPPPPPPPPPPPSSGGISGGSLFSLGLSSSGSSGHLAGHGLTDGIARGLRNMFGTGESTKGSEEASVILSTSSPFVSFDSQK